MGKQTAKPSKNPLTFKVTPVFVKNKEAKTRFVINEGGSRSSKTYSLAHLFLDRLIENRKKPYLISVVRKTLPSLRATAMKDFFDILKSYNVYEEEHHNKSDHIYKIGKAEIEFFSIDDSQKVHGRKRDDLWVNEANEMKDEDFIQLKLRTSGQIYLDYNPSDLVSWIYEIKDDVTWIHSTFRDNPFNPPAIVKELELLEKQSEWHWQVYGLGKRAISKETIYTNWDEVRVIPLISNIFYGLDFGYGHHCALIEIAVQEMELWEREVIYRTQLTTPELIALMKSHIVNRALPVYADEARPDLIEEIYQAGFNIHPVAKGKESVRNGIDLVRRFKVHMHHQSVNLIRERKSYKWLKDKNGNVLQEPVSFRNHLMDAERYAVKGHLGKYFGKLAGNDSPGEEVVVDEVFDRMRQF